MNSAATAIDVRDVTKTYVLGDVKVEALRGVRSRSRAASTSRSWASGSGKSTLMNLLGCLDVPTTDGSARRNRRLDVATTRWRRFVCASWASCFKLQPAAGRARSERRAACSMRDRRKGARRDRHRAAARGRSGDRLDHKPASFQRQQQRVAIAARW